MKIITNTKKRLATPFRWFFAKRKRWIPAIVLLALIALPFLAHGVTALYIVIDHTLDDFRYHKGEETRIEQLWNDFEDNQEKWESSNITSYEFKLDLFFGASEMWEGFGGISTGANINRSLVISVRNNSTIQTMDTITGNPIELNENQHCDSMSELFIIIHDVLNGRDNQDLVSKADIYEEAGIKLTPSRRSIYAEFSSEYGYPTLIAIYEHRGNYEYFTKYYEIVYSVSDFEIILE